MKFDRLSQLTIVCAIEVHRVLGTGLLESTYERCLAHELGLAGLRHKTQHPLPVEYKGVQLDCGYRIDVLVEESLIVELKAVEALEPRLARADQGAVGPEAPGQSLPGL